jgi:hypothetical protein
MHLLFGLSQNNSFEDSCHSSKPAEQKERTKMQIFPFFPPYAKNFKADTRWAAIKATYCQVVYKSHKTSWGDINFLLNAKL